MIVVLGPASLAARVAGVHPGELVVGAADDDRLAGPVRDAAEIAAVLPIPARACVLAASASPIDDVDAVRRAGGSLLQARIVVLGEPPSGEAPATWRSLLGRLGATAVADTTEVALELSRDPADAVPSPGETRPQPVAEPLTDTAWRDALRAARPRRLLPRRRRALDRRGDGELEAAIRRPLAAGCHSVAVISPKGGVGKTTLSFLLGSVLARVRADRVLVVDTNPDFGTLADLTGEPTPATISDLLRDLRFVTSDQSLAAYVTETRTGMHVLAAPQDPTEMARLGAGGYRAVSDVIRRHYDLAIFDCGTGFLDDVTQFVLRNAGHVVLVTDAQLVSAKIVLSALERLAVTGFDRHRITLAVNRVGGDDPLDVGRLAEMVTPRAGGVVEVPLDVRMQRDIDVGAFSYARMQATTRTAIGRLAAAVVAGLPHADSSPTARAIMAATAAAPANGVATRAGGAVGGAPRPADGAWATAVDGEQPGRAQVAASSRP